MSLPAGIRRLLHYPNCCIQDETRTLSPPSLLSMLLLSMLRCRSRLRAPKRQQAAAVQGGFATESGMLFRIITWLLSGLGLEYSA
jgi:hypothetical protein